MKKSTLCLLWGGLFIVCAGLGFIPEPTGGLKILLTCLSVAFFIPPALLLYTALREQDSATIAVIRNLSIASLVLTIAALVSNFLCLMASEAVGNVLYAILVIVSAPMVCSQYWALSLFLWACLLMVSLPQKTKKTA